jgi:hypothetical protein
MEKQIKRVIKKNNKFVVEKEDRELAQYLIKKLLESKRDNVEVEWVFSYESPLVKPLMGKQWFTWVFGACAKEVGLIHIFLDNVLKVYNIFGFEPVEEWFSNECVRHLVHELIHFHNPEWTENQVQRATEKLMEAHEGLHCSKTVKNEGET